VDGSLRNKKNDPSGGHFSQTFRINFPESFHPPNIPRKDYFKARYYKFVWEFCLGMKNLFGGEKIFSWNKKLRIKDSFLGPNLGPKTTREKIVFFCLIFYG